MLQQIQNLPAHVVGVHATGEVTKEDMETVLIPLLDDLVKRKDKINYIWCWKRRYSSLPWVPGGMI